VPRFLSAAWFEEVAPAAQEETSAAGEERLLVERVVTGTPDGEVRYQVLLSQAGVKMVPPQALLPGADLTITCEWATACAIARGDIPALAALMEGRLQVRGDLSRLGRLSHKVAKLDVLSPAVRARTTW
jgi:hypothetical protein